MFDSIQPPEASTYTAEPAAAPTASNTTTIAELLKRAKAAIEAGEQSLQEAAEALGVAQELHGTSQAEMARAIGKSEAWVSYLLRWRRSGYKDESPFGPRNKAGRLKHAEDRAASGKSRPPKSGNPNPTAPAETASTVFSRPIAEPTQKTRSDWQESPEAPDRSAAGTEKPEPAKTRSAVNPKDDALLGFSAAVVELMRRIGKRDAERFAKTSIPADELAKIGNFFTTLANLKKNNANSTVFMQQSAEGLNDRNETTQARLAA
jgi:hypothetical protein